MNIGKLKKVELRNMWQDEARDFTPWLAKEENLKLLSDELGIELEYIDKEAPVGDYSLDILAEDESSGKTRKVIIENQLEKSDHDHLGKILTYASGYDAEIIIWIVKDIKEEHRQAIDWLNNNTGENRNFFAIKLELWQIDESAYAPKFQIVCKPNSWGKTLKNQNNDISTERKIKLLNFWNKFHEYLENKKSDITPFSPSTNGWLNMAIGTSKAHLSFTARVNGNLGCEIYIRDNKDFYKELEKHKNDIEQKAEINFDWQELPDAKASRIAIYRDGFDLFNSTNWDKDFNWLEDMAHKFLKGFKDYL